jgi:Tfp pilus assembly protein PilX
MKGTKGSALVAVLLTVTVLSILGVAIVTVMWQRMHIAVSYEDSVDAYYAAQAGIEDLKLQINNRITSSAATINSQLQAYYDNHHSDPGYNMNAQIDIVTRNVIFQGWTVSNNNVPLDVNSNYSISLNGTNYNLTNHTIPISSTGHYKTASKTINLTIQVAFGNQISIVGADAPPLVISSSNPASNSMKLNCKNFESSSSIHIPRGIAGFSSTGNTSYKFLDKFTIDDDLTLDDNQAYFEVENDMMVNGDLKLSSNQVKVVVNKGNLYVNGNIDISSSGAQIKVTQGNIICNGNISITGNISKLTVGGNVYTKTTIVPKANQGIIVSIGGSTILNNYNVNIPPVSTAPIPTPASQTYVSAIDNNIPLDNTLISPYLINKTYTLGSPTNPVVIYNNGNIDISLSYLVTQIDIYGIVFATGNINSSAYGEPPAQVNIHGMAITGGMLNIDNNNINVKLLYDSTVMTNINRLFPYIATALSGSGGGGGGGGSSTTVNIASGFTTTSWDE